VESEEDRDDARVLYTANKCSRRFKAEDVLSAGEAAPQLAAWVSQFGRDGALDRVQVSLDRMLAKNLIAKVSDAASFDGGDTVPVGGYTITGAGREWLREIYGAEELS